VHFGKRKHGSEEEEEIGEGREEVGEDEDMDV
jgi:hypothetical protein